MYISDVRYTIRHRGRARIYTSEGPFFLIGFLYGMRCLMLGRMMEHTP